MGRGMRKTGSRLKSPKRVITRMKRIGKELAFWATMSGESESSLLLKEREAEGELEAGRVLAGS